MRTLYLQESLTLDGRSALKGRTLFDKLSRSSEETLLGYIVTEGEAVLSNPDVRDDVVTLEMLRDLSPNVTWLEGGLFQPSVGTQREPPSWRFPRPHLETFVRNGGVAMILDADRSRVSYHLNAYDEAQGLLGARIARGTYNRTPLYCADPSSGWKSDKNIVVESKAMFVSQWLRHVYDGIDEIIVGRPLSLAHYQDILASCNPGTTGTVSGDYWVDRQHGCPFASVSQFGHGYVAFFAGAVSGDYWLERCPTNTQWLLNAAELLLDEATANRRRTRSHLRSKNRVFLSHTSSDKDVVRSVAAALKELGIATWLDEERIHPAHKLLEELGGGLDQMSHFVIFWSAMCASSEWVGREIEWALARPGKRKAPIILVRLDGTTPPAPLGEFAGIRAAQMRPEEIAESIARALVDA